MDDNTKSYFGKAKLLRVVGCSIEWTKNFHGLVVARLSLQHFLKALHCLHTRQALLWQHCYDYEVQCKNTQMYVNLLTSHNAQSAALSSVS